MDRPVFSGLAIAGHVKVGRFRWMSPGPERYNSRLSGLVSSEEICMKRPMGRGLAVAVVLATSLWACGDSTTTTTPITPTPAEKITETFTGTLALQGTDYYGFAAKSAGVVTTTLTSLSPDNTVAIGVAVGTFDGLSCTPVVLSETAKVGSVLIGTATAPINLCLKVYDVGTITDPTTYTVTIDHY
jgi:hypothetical protein